MRLRVKTWLPSWIIVVLLGGWTIPAHAQDELALPKFRPPRWLEILEVDGSVLYQPVQRQPQAAEVGALIRDVGDQVSTGTASKTTLIFDEGIGQVFVTEDTLVEVTRMEKGPRGGYITHLAVPQGLAILRVRQLVNPESELKIDTPAGTAGVRGTEFGLGINPDGKTSVATGEGSVTVTAQGRVIVLEEGFASIISPGEEPTPPITLTGSLRLELERLVAQIQDAHVVGRVDPVNLVYLNQQLVNTTLDGHFDEVIPINSDRDLEIKVISPLGDEKLYSFIVPYSGWQLYEANHLPEARALFQAQLTADPRDWDALLGLAYVNFQANELTEAQQQFEQVLQVFPDYSGALVGLGQVYLQQGDLESALDQFQKAALEQPDDPEIQALIQQTQP